MLISHCRRLLEPCPIVQCKFQEVSLLRMILCFHSSSSHILQAKYIDFRTSILILYFTCTVQIFWKKYQNWKKAPNLGKPFKARTILEKLSRIRFQMLEKCFNDINKYIIDNRLTMLRISIISFNSVHCREDGEFWWKSMFRRIISECLLFMLKIS